MELSLEGSYSKMFWVESRAWGGCFLGLSKEQKGGGREVSEW